MPKYKALVSLKQNIRLLELLLDFKGQLLTKYSSPDDYPVDYHVYDQKYTPEYQEALEVTYALITETRMITEEAGAKYTLVVLANSEQSNPLMWQDLQKIYPTLKKAEIDLEKPDKLLERFCGEEKITCLFMLHFFQEYTKNHPTEITHFLYDNHWNKTGTGLAAQFLTKYLEELLLDKVILKN
tara:strand:+ start:1002 stop:1553 length:552 start_codon:yes stop_codon:yes gene_type:complete